MSLLMCERGCSDINTGGKVAFFHAGRFFCKKMGGSRKGANVLAFGGLGLPVVAVFGRMALLKSI